MKVKVTQINAARAQLEPDYAPTVAIYALINR